MLDDKIEEIVASLLPRMKSWPMVYKGHLFLTVPTQMVEAGSMVTYDTIQRLEQMIDRALTEHNVKFYGVEWHSDVDEVSVVFSLR